MDGGSRFARKASEEGLATRGKEYWMYLRFSE
jgi:hypothetical protein